jgi:hypothetical protein
VRAADIDGEHLATVCDRQLREARADGEHRAPYGVDSPDPHPPAAALERACLEVDVVVLLGRRHGIAI